LIKPASVSLWLAPVIVAATTACSGQPGTAAKAGASVAPTPPAASAGMPAAAPAHEPSNGPAPAGAGVASGVVVETMNASTYTYVKVKTDTGEIWAASSQFDVKVGDRVTLPLEQPMENFRSQSLDRVFPLIYFASRITRDGDPAAAQPAQMPAGHPPVSTKPVVTEKIAPPPGGRSVADVWADRKALAGKTVSLRGKVVKSNGGIMGRNWVHLQDGSGTAADRTNDITVTTDEVVKVGDTITVTGTVAVDRDFGAGYTYTVIVEGAKVVAR
jgi:hypothetical protein